MQIINFLVENWYKIKSILYLNIQPIYIIVNILYQILLLKNDAVYIHTSERRPS